MIKLSQADIDAELAKRCLRSLSFFVKEFWSITVPEPLKWNWHMDVLCDEVQVSDERVFAGLPKLHDLIFNVPPGTSKTKILSIFSTCWEFARKHDIKVAVGSFSDDAVIGIADEIGLVMESEKYKRYFPEVKLRKDYNNKHEFKTETNGYFYAFTVGGTITSKHFSILKIDDPLNPKNIASVAQLHTANNFFDVTLPTRKVDKALTPTYVVMQRLDDNDPTGHLLRKKADGIHHISLPGCLVDPVSGGQYDVKPEKYRSFYVNGILDANRLTQTDLMSLRIDLGSANFPGQVGQTPVSPGGLIWQKWFNVIDDAQFPAIEDASQVGTDWDTALTEKEINAASAYITAGKIGTNKFIFDLDFAWLEMPELVKWVKTKRSPHFIEAKANGKSIKQTLTRAGIAAIEIPVKGGEDKIVRAKSSTPFVEAGGWYIKRSLAEKLYNDPKQGILRFPKGQFMDLADTLAQCVQRLSGAALVTSTGSREPAKVQTGVRMTY